MSSLSRLASGDTPLPRRMRQVVLIVHIIAGVGLLGDSAGFLAIAIRGSLTDDIALQRSAWELLRMFGYLFGIPLSFTTLLTGIVLGLGGPWGVLRSPWVTAKLLIVLAVIATGALAIDPALHALVSGDSSGEPMLVAAAAGQVVGLVVATALSVIKPGGRSWDGLRGSSSRRRATEEERVPQRR